MMQHVPTHSLRGRWPDPPPVDWARDRPRGLEWLASVFDCRAVEVGGIIRRQIVDVEREVGRAVFEAEVRRRGFRLVRTQHHYLIVCNQGRIDVVF